MEDIRRVKPLNNGKEWSRVNTIVHMKHIKQMDTLVRERRGVTKKHILFSALEDFFSPTVSEDVSQQILAQLRTIERDLKRVRGRQDMLLDVFSVFVKVWMCHTHDVPQDQEDAAMASMKRRYERFKQLVLDEFSDDEDLFSMSDRNGVRE